MRLFAASALSLILCPIAAAQVTLNASVTADNLFTAYVTTNPDIDGTSFLSGNNWQVVSSGSTVLTDPGTYYLNILAQDQGAPMMLIGLFTLDSTDATFANGAQTLVTNPADWTSSAIGFSDAGAGAPVDIGPNGTGPWGNFAALGPDAHYIWHPGFPATAYFTTVITVVPAPAAALAPAALLGVLALRRRR